MPKVSVAVHPFRLHPIEAVKAHYKYTEGDMSLDEIIREGEIFNLAGDLAGRNAVYAAIGRVRKMSPSDLVPPTKYNNCGRKKALTEDQEKEIVVFVKKWRAKLLCICHYIRNELGLDVTPKTVNNVLNNAGYYWKLVPRIQGLTNE